MAYHLSKYVLYLFVRPLVNNHLVNNSVINCHVFVVVVFLSYRCLNYFIRLILTIAPDITFAGCLGVKKHQSSTFDFDPFVYLFVLNSSVHVPDPRSGVLRI